MVEGTSQSVSTPDLIRPLKLSPRIFCWDWGCAQGIPIFLFFSPQRTHGSRPHGGIFTNRILIHMIYDSPRCISGAHCNTIDRAPSGHFEQTKLRIRPSCISFSYSLSIDSGHLFLSSQSLCYDSKRPSSHATVHGPNSECIPGPLPPKTIHAKWPPRIGTSPLNSPIDMPRFFCGRETFETLAKAK